MDAALSAKDIKKMLPPDSRSLMGLSEAELLERARAERAAIVHKYERGRLDGDNEGSEEIAPPWEDPQYEDYHVTDKWGFIHDTRLPATHSKEEERSIEVEANRMLKWNKMTKSWDKYHGAGVKHRAGGGSSKHMPAHHQVSDKLYNRIYKGVPACFRGLAWGKLLNLDTLKKEQRGKYTEMKSLGCKWSPDVRQIDLDVNRTFRDNIMFRKRYDVKQQQLFYMLVAYSVYNQEVGYCQGMSQIAALLLMYMDEEDAFWALSALMADTKYAMHGFFIPGFPKLMRFQEQHNKILSQKLPNLYKHLQRNCIDAGLYTLKWFFQCYLDRVPFPLCLRLWDVYLLEGERLLLAAGYTILKLHRRAIQQLDMDRILDFIQKKLVVDFGMPEDEMVTAVRKSLDELRRGKLDHPGPPPLDELPTVPFGTFVEPSLSAVTGVRVEAGEQELQLTRQLIDEQERLERCRTEAHKGSHTSLDQSIDDVSSVGGGASGVAPPSSAAGGANSASLAGFGSRISLANTSLTSAPDLSTLSSLTLARRNDTDQGSILSEKMSGGGGDVGGGLSGSGRSLVSPDAKSVQSVRSPRSPPVGRDGVSASAGTDSSSLSAAADSGLGSFKRSSSRAKKSSNRQHGDKNSLVSSAATAASHPHLASSSSPSRSGGRLSRNGRGEGDEMGETLMMGHYDNRRSVQSDDGYYDQSDSIPYTNFSQYSNGGGGGGVGDSDSDDLDVDPSSNPSKCRPSKLSVSQTTLIRDPDTVNSEPATPRAGETPDTVRLYVPYAEDEDGMPGERSPGPARPASGQNGVMTEFQDGYSRSSSAAVNNKNASLSDRASGEERTENDVNRDFSRTQLTRGKHTSDYNSLGKTSASQNSATESLVVTLRELDPFKIKIRVDADETLSSLSSPRDPNSPRSATSPGQFIFGGPKVVPNSASTPKDTTSFGREPGIADGSLGRSTGDHPSRTAAISSDTPHSNGFVAKTDKMPYSSSSMYQLTSAKHSEKNENSSRQSDLSISLSPEKLSSVSHSGRMNSDQGLDYDATHSNSYAPSMNIPPSSKGSLEFTSLRTAVPKKSVGGTATLHSEAVTKQTERPAVPLRQSPAERPAVPSRQSPANSPVHVTISSYYETKHHRNTASRPVVSAAPDNGDVMKKSTDSSSDSGKIQHYYIHRQSSTSPPPPLPGNSTSGSPVHSTSSKSVSNQSSLSRDRKQSQPLQNYYTQQPQQQSPYGSSSSPQRHRTHYRNLSEHSHLAYPESAGPFSSSGVLRPKDFNPQQQPSLSSSASSLLASSSSPPSSRVPQERKDVAASSYKAFSSSIVERSIYNASSSSYQQHRESTNTTSETMYSKYSTESKHIITKAEPPHPPSRVFTSPGPPDRRYQAPPQHHQQQNFKHFIADEPLTESFTRQKSSYHHQQQQYQPSRGSDGGVGVRNSSAISPSTSAGPNVPRFVKASKAMEAEKQHSRRAQAFQVTANAFRDGQR